MNGQTAGIMPVLVLGAGTDYALLLISRYREELHNYPNRFDAMIKAWRGSVPAIVASAATVILGLLCLSFSSLESNKSLGPAGAISIACTLLLSITFLPVALASAGRWVFWPRKPKVDQVGRPDQPRLLGRRRAQGRPQPPSSLDRRRCWCWASA